MTESTVAPVWMLVPTVHCLLSQQHPVRTFGHYIIQVGVTRVSFPLIISLFLLHFSSSRRIPGRLCVALLFGGWDLTSRRSIQG